MITFTEINIGISSMADVMVMLSCSVVTASFS